MLLMMCLLVLYVLQSFVNNRLTHRKCAITTLPFKSLISVIYCFNPSAAVALYFFHYMGNALALGEQEKDMYMVSCSTCLYHTASRGVDQLTYIGMDAFQILIANMRTGGLDMEYQMDV